MPEKKKKVFLLDTNVLLHDPMSLYSFGDSTVAIPMMALEELDKFKHENSDRGRNAREVVRRLDQLRELGSLNKGVVLDHGGMLFIVFPPLDEIKNIVLTTEFGDEGILGAALFLKRKGYDVHFISKDINARVKADVLGVQAEDYLKGRVTPEEFYKGWVREEVAAAELKKDEPKILQSLIQEYDLAANQFVWLCSKNNDQNYRIFRYVGDKRFKAVYTPHFVWPLKPRNPEQLMALNLLMDKDIPLVCLLGPAGTGKTFLSLLAGLHQVLIEDYYKKMLVARPVVPLGPDIGYLPGDIQEKLHSWMQPIYDNMELISQKAMTIPSEAEYDHLEQVAREAGKKQHHKKKRQHHHQDYRISPLDRMIREDKISLEAITYMRGRSIPNQYILIDEVQNLSPHEVKTIVTRVGENSKIILSGDPYQIDSPYLDFSSNGLVVVSNAFKGQKIAGTVYLDISERSELSRLAGSLL
ncbi:TPA: phosphate starvation-inducible protein PhoH [Candidatus Dependentiae bacterium]|nr:MAG: PhoH family protein [candidate division TM6 bacterium GW2011_GWF2_36_131]KKQ02630.1 MAG: PhoH family protein [candidate division TM6 bacterium GW2011_GWE2_36_25]KKQ19236.1 MAG: PhoH family protein [candidate division TM6 bacterium GW2011_GWA2_36_9]HBR70261.1 phosphate starvation-inducible protein PhoH [Candidatus Dependentiae bacterium]HCU00967.1 phosphate starvation-inducible protein PhoH [Candidatus Dependentiae bacterium]